MVARHAHVGEVENHAPLVQETHDDAFTVNHRDDRHADIDLAVLHAHLDAAVLWQALLGDVEPGHDLDAADDRGLETGDCRVHFLRLQYAVHAVTDPQCLFFGLDVDVAGPFVGGVDQDFVDELDDRRFLGHLGHFAVVGLDVLQQLHFIVGPLLDHRADGVAANAEMRLDEPGDLARAGQYRLHAQAGQRLQFIERIDIERISGRHDDRAVLSRQGPQSAAMHELERHRLEHFRLNRYLR